MKEIMYQGIALIILLTFYLEQTHEQATEIYVRKEDICSKSSSWIQQMLNEKDFKIHDHEKKIGVLQDKIVHLLEWKATHEKKKETEFNQLHFPNEGYKVYYIGFLKNHNNPGYNSILISSKNATSVHVYSRQPSYDNTYSIGSNKYKYIKDISREIDVISNTTVTRQGILVNATDDVFIQAGSVRQYTLDGFNVIQIGPDSEEYLIVSYGDNNDPFHSGCIVVGTQNNTSVKIYKPVAGGGREFAAQTVINKLDTYAWYSSKHQDATGFRVISDKPIAVYAGHQYASVEDTSLDHLVSSIPPISRLGTNYIVPPVPGVPGTLGYIIKVVAHEPHTEITLTRDFILYNTVLQDQQYIEKFITPSDEPLNVKCTKRCLVAQITIGPETLKMDSYMMIMTPTSALSQNVRFGTLTPYGAVEFQDIYLTIISANQSITSYELNREVLQTSWHTVPGMDEDSYVYSTTKIESGFYHLKSTSPTGGFAAYVQGFNNPNIGWEGFGYRLGLF